MRMNQAHIHILHSPLFFFAFTNLSLDSTKGTGDEWKIVSIAFSMQATMVQSTINSQCGQLQSARSRAIRSKFQAWFCSVSDMVCLSMRYEGVMTVQFCLLGCEMAEMELMTAQLERWSAPAAPGLIVNGWTWYWNSIYLHTAAFPPNADKHDFEIQVVCSLFSST